jgi:hypothetical protein
VLLLPARVEPLMLLLVLYLLPLVLVVLQKVPTTAGKLLPAVL